MLRWNIQDNTESDPGVSWIELFISFQLGTNSDMPANVGTNTIHRFALPEQSPAAMLIQLNTHRRMQYFDSSLKALTKILRSDIFPCKPCKKPASLPQLGYFQGRPGLPRRPWFPYHEEIVHLLRQRADSPATVGSIPDLFSRPHVIEIPWHEDDLLESQATRRAQMTWTTSG